VSDHECRWMFHSTAIVPDYDVTCGALANLAGLRVLEYSESEVPEVGRRGGMTWVGDNSIEIGQPIIAGAGAAKFVDRTGGGLHSVAVQVRDLPATMDHLQSIGIPIAARPDDGFCFSDPRATGGVFFEWSSLEVHEDPRFGAALPPYTTEPLLAVTHQAWVGAVVDDPIRLAGLLAQALGSTVTVEKPGAAPDEPAAAIPVGRDCMLALYAMPGEASRTLWGRSYTRGRTHLLALKVDDLEAARQALAGAGVTLVRQNEHELVVDPAVTGEAAIALVDQLLPGDPRR
jgi:hypothetical protein